LLDKECISYKQTIFFDLYAFVLCIHIFSSLKYSYKFHENKWCFTSISFTVPFLTSNLSSWNDWSSHSGLKLKENWDMILNSHFRPIQPGLFKKLQGWYLSQKIAWTLFGHYEENIYSCIKSKYHLLSTSEDVQNISIHKCKTCSLRPRQIKDLNFTSICTFSCDRLTISTQRYKSYRKKRGLANTIKRSVRY